MMSFFEGFEKAASGLTGGLAGGAIGGLIGGAGGYAASAPGLNEKSNTKHRLKSSLVGALSGMAVGGGMGTAFGKTVGNVSKKFKEKTKVLGPRKKKVVYVNPKTNRTAKIHGRKGGAQISKDLLETPSVLASRKAAKYMAAYSKAQKEVMAAMHGPNIDTAMVALGKKYQVFAKKLTGRDLGVPGTKPHDLAIFDASKQVNKLVDRQRQLSKLNKQRKLNPGELKHYNSLGAQEAKLREKIKHHRNQVQKKVESYFKKNKG